MYVAPETPATFALCAAIALAAGGLAWAGQQGVDSNQPNYVNICTCLELLTFLLSILRKVLTNQKPALHVTRLC